MYQKRIKWVEEYLEKLQLNEEIREYYSGKSILIVGGAGAIGSNLVIGLAKLVGLEYLIIYHQ